MNDDFFIPKFQWEQRDIGLHCCKSLNVWRFLSASASASALHASQGALMGEHMKKPGLSDTGRYSPLTLPPNRTNDGFWKVVTIWDLKPHQQLFGIPLTRVGPFSALNASHDFRMSCLGHLEKYWLAELGRISECWHISLYHMTSPLFSVKGGKAFKHLEAIKLTLVDASSPKH